MDERKSFMHVKPWSNSFSDPACGCLLERGIDGGLRYFPCPDCQRALLEVRARKRREQREGRLTEGRRIVS